MTKSSTRPHLHTTQTQGSRHTGPTAQRQWDSTRRHTEQRRRHSPVRTQPLLTRRRPTAHDHQDSSPLSSRVGSRRSQTQALVQHCSAFLLARAAGVAPQAQFRSQLLLAMALGVAPLAQRRSIYIQVLAFLQGVAPQVCAHRQCILALSLGVAPLSVQCTSVLQFVLALSAGVAPHTRTSTDAERTSPQRAAPDESDRATQQALSREVPLYL